MLTNGRVQAMDRPHLISEALEALERGEVTSEDLTSAALEKARRLEHLNIFATLDAKRALAAAKESDTHRRSGRKRQLEGVPITIKDLFNVRGIPARGGSKAPMPNLGPEEEGTAVSRLRAAGAVILGTTNMHEVGLGLTGENPSTGDVRNPFDPARQVGGSSSGAGAAMGADIGFASLGSDTGGSIRVPSSHCGASSFKPTLGVVPLDGALPLAPTCDHAGPITNSVQDARLITEIMAARSICCGTLELSRPPKLGVPWRFLEGRLSPEVRRAFEGLMERLKPLAESIVEATPHAIDLAPSVYTTICWAEAAHAHRLTATKDTLTLFTPRVQISLKHGLSVTAVDYLQAFKLGSTKSSPGATLRH
jgi:aspartyl-tRNA(Asn)/glutamyl-tRNA(Gln) amidotransferase subunit A